MKPISQQHITDVISEAAQQTSLKSVLNELHTHQPDVMSFLMLTLKEQRVQAGMHACHLGWCVYRAFQRAWPRPLPKVLMDDLVKKGHLNNGLLQQRATSQQDFMAVMSLEMANQPVILDFVRQCVADILTGKLAEDRQLVHEAMAIFLAVKTVVDAFDAATDQPIAEIDPELN